VLLVEAGGFGVLGDAEDSCPMSLSLVESVKEFVQCCRVSRNGMVHDGYPTPSITEKRLSQHFLCMNLLSYRHDPIPLFGCPLDLAQIRATVKSLPVHNTTRILDI
jgi:hypothetical protein